MLLLLKCRVYTGLGFHSEEYILDQIHKVSRSLKCYPCPPAPVLAHTTWDQSGSLRLASLRACRSQGCSNLFLIVRNCWLCSIYCRSVQEACSLIYYNKFGKHTCTTYAT